MLLWYVIVFLIILWLFGFGLHIGGPLVHVLILLAAIVLVVQLLTRRRED